MKALTRRTTQCLGMTLANPVIVGSGLLTDQERNIRRLLALGAGAVISKTIHPSPPTDLDERILHLPTGMLNSTTYSKRPIDAWLRMLDGFTREKLPVIISVHADTPDQLGALVRRIDPHIDTAFELGISCLNETDGLTDTPRRVEQYTQAARSETRKSIAVKLAIGPDLDDRIQASVAAGADAITLSDTIPGLAIDGQTGTIRLGGVFGYSGPGIKPLVLAAIHQLRSRGLTTPIIGSGGVQSGADVAEYLAVGSQAVQVYTALHNQMAQTLTAILSQYSDQGRSLREVENAAMPIVLNE